MLPAMWPTRQKVILSIYSKWHWYVVTVSKTNNSTVYNKIYNKKLIFNSYFHNPMFDIFHRTSGSSSHFNNTHPEHYTVSKCSNAYTYIL